MDKFKDLTSKNSKIFLAVAVVLLVTAFIGYAFETIREPQRVAFATKGGGVIFSHLAHTDIDEIECEDCHHLDENDDEQIEKNCRTCHYNRDNLSTCEDESIHKRCIAVNCINCHVDGSVQCSFCHNAEYFKIPVEPEIVEFDNENGLIEFDHFAHADPDEYGFECGDCHHDYEPNNKIFPMNCRRCHLNTKYEPICEDDEYHTKCIGVNCIDCHEDGNDDCEMCHE